MEIEAWTTHNRNEYQYGDGGFKLLFLIIVMSRKVVRMKICGFQEAYIRKSQKNVK